MCPSIFFLWFFIYFLHIFLLYQCGIAFLGNIYILQFVYILSPFFIFFYLLYIFLWFFGYLIRFQSPLWNFTFRKFIFIYLSTCDVCDRRNSSIRTFWWAISTIRELIFVDILFLFFHIFQYIFLWFFGYFLIFYRILLVYASGIGFLENLHFPICQLQQRHYLSDLDQSFVRSVAGETAASVDFDGPSLPSVKCCPSCSSTPGQISLLISFKYTPLRCLKKVLSKDSGVISL